MAARNDFPLIGRYFTEEWAVYAASYGSLLLDLFIAPALLWRRTRLPAFGVAVLFHLSNARLFSIRCFSMARNRRHDSFSFAELATQIALNLSPEA